MNTESSRDNLKPQTNLNCDKRWTFMNKVLKVRDVHKLNNYSTTHTRRCVSGYYKAALSHLPLSYDQYHMQPKCVLTS